MAGQYLTPKEIVGYTIDGGINKTERRSIVVFISAIMAGIFIAMGAIASNTAAYSIDNSGIAKMILGAIFPVGLMLIIIVGADLFTSNCMLSMAVLEKKISLLAMLKNITIVYLGNFTGALLMAYMEITAGQFDMGHGALGGFHINLAVHKLEASFGQAILLGIMCNIIVCAAALMMYSGKDIISKIWGGFFPIFAFIIAGFQHSIANMYYVPAAIMASKNPLYVDAANISSEQLAELTWGNFLIHNLLPVTIGNFIGGAVVIGAVYWFMFSHKSSEVKYKESSSSEKEPAIV